MLEFRISTEELEDAAKEALVENAPKLILTNVELKSKEDTVEFFHRVHERLNKNEIGKTKSSLEALTLIKGLFTKDSSEERGKSDFELKPSESEVIEKCIEAYDESNSIQNKNQDWELKNMNIRPISSSEDRINPTITPKKETVLLRFQTPHQKLPDSQLSSLSSFTADSSLSDLYCDDELKLSLEFDPNMQLFTTIEEELEQDFLFPNIEKTPEGKPS